MLQQESMVVVADNSQAKKAKVIRVLKWSSGRFAKVGDRVVVAVREVAPGSTLKKGDIAQAVVVRTKKETRRTDGSYIRFADNAVVLLTKDAKGNMSPIGKRVFGPVARELRENYRNITNMAEEVL